MGMRVYAAVGATLEKAGVDTVFGLIGDANLKLVPHLTNQLGMRFVRARHESAALAMADGYARSTGRLGVCTTTQGPGLTNTFTALVSARRAHTPLLVLAGDCGIGSNHLQAIDQERMFAAAGVSVVPVAADTASRDVAKAIEVAFATSSPVGINLTEALQEQDYLGPIETPSRPTTPSDVTVPSTEELDRVLEVILTARRPIVLAGRGVLLAGVEAETVALADELGALLATSIPAKGMFTGHPWDMGIAGGFSSDQVTDVFRAADCVIALGAALNQFTMRRGTLLDPDARVIHLDIDEGAIGRQTAVDAGLRGDLAVTLPRLLEAVAGRGRDRGAFRTEAVAERLRAPRYPFDDASDDVGIDPRTIVQTIDRVIPSLRGVVTDGGHYVGFPAMMMGVEKPRDFVFALDFGSLGLGLGSAIGAAVGRPERPTVLFIGDGGFMMSLGDLDTAVRECGDELIVVVMNDSAYGAEMHLLRMLGIPEDTTVFPMVDVAGIAKTLGADAVTVRALDDLEELERCLTRRRRVLVVDARITTNVRAGWFLEAFQARGLARR